MTPLRLTLAVLTLFGLALLGAGHLGRWWPPGDSLAVGRLQVLAVAVPVLAGLWWSGGRRLAVVATMVCGVSSSLTIAQSWRFQTGPLYGAPPPFLVYQKNLLFNGTDRALLVDDIRASGAEFVTLQEVSEANIVVLESLQSDYPHQILCPFSAVGGVAILSRYPFEPDSAHCAAEGLVVVRAGIPGNRRVLIVSLHLHWPWPFGQARQVHNILSALADVGDDAMVIAGDFSMQPWGWSVRSLPGDRVGGYGSTYPRFGSLLPLVIDHVKVRGGGGLAELRPLFGSDHHGLLVEVALQY